MELKYRRILSYFYILELQNFKVKKYKKQIFGDFLKPFNNTLSCNLADKWYLHLA